MTLLLLARLALLFAIGVLLTAFIWAGRGTREE